MNSIIDKIESAISLEWHIVWGLDYSLEQMKHSSEFAFAVTPYLGEEHYKNDDTYWGFERHPYMIKYLKSKTWYDIPILNVNAPLGTSVWQIEVDWIQAEDNGDDLDERYKRWIESYRRIDPLPEYFHEMVPPSNHDYCQVCKISFKNYFKHITSAYHQKNFKLNEDLFAEIDHWSKDLNTKFNSWTKNKKLTEFVQIKMQEEIKSGKKSAWRAWVPVFDAPEEEKIDKSAFPINMSEMKTASRVLGKKHPIVEHI